MPPPVAPSPPNRLRGVLVALAVGVGVLVALLQGGRLAGLLVLALVGLLGWLSWSAWPGLGRGQRLLRLVVLGLLVGWSVSTLVVG